MEIDLLTLETWLNMNTHNVNNFAWMLYLLHSQFFSHYNSERGYWLNPKNPQIESIENCRKSIFVF